MDLFHQNNEPFNILPKDGEAYYFGSIFNTNESNELFTSLAQNIDWEKDVVTVFGKVHKMNRASAWYGENNLEYGYSGISRKAFTWTPELLQVKQIVETFCETSFNSCLLNYYPSGNDGMGWHADNEKELGINPTIASLSLGAERKFSFKHNTEKITKSVILENGSLLIMQKEIQHFWKHALPKTKKINSPRINLTFRKILGN